MTPDHFTTEATAWVTAIGTVAGAIIVGAISLYSLFQSKITQVKMEENTARLSRQGADIKTILLNTPPPGTTAPVDPTSTEPPAGA